MTIVGFSFTKLNVERKDGNLGKMKINNTVALNTVDKVPLNLGKGKDNCLKVNFSFESKYDPDVGAINLEGYLLYMEDEKKMDDLAAQWKKEKKLPKDLMQAFMNNILNKCTVESVILSREINLPPSIQPPRVTVK